MNEFAADVLGGRLNEGAQGKSICRRCCVLQERRLWTRSLVDEVDLEPVLNLTCTCGMSGCVWVELARLPCMESLVLRLYFNVDSHGQRKIQVVYSKYEYLQVFYPFFNQQKTGNKQQNSIETLSACWRGLNYKEMRWKHMILAKKNNNNNCLTKTKMSSNCNKARPTDAPEGAQVFEEALALYSSPLLREGLKRSSWVLANLLTLESRLSSHCSCTAEAVRPR